MEDLSSRVLVRPTDFERSFRFYAESLGLHVYREWSNGSTKGVVFFVGGGFLELSGSSRTGASEMYRYVVASARSRRRRTRAGRGRSGYYRASATNKPWV
jgi:catechol 2,3-dioxygenase-like lactoylglutathione lyase family enzyme